MFQIIISGGAYLQVLRPNGTIVYTSGRNFMINDSGVIVTEEEYILQPIFTVPLPFDNPIKITEQGELYVFYSGAWHLINTIIAVVFIHPELLQDIGNGYFDTTDGSGAPILGQPGSGELFANVKTFYFTVSEKKHRPLAALNEPGAIADFIIKARMIVKRIADNTGGYFANTVPLPATVADDIHTLEAAEDRAKTLVVGAVQVRNVAFKVVIREMFALQRYVQLLADARVGGRRRYGPRRADHIGRNGGFSRCTGCARRETCGA